MQEYDAIGREEHRLDRGTGALEELRTRELLTRWLPPAPATVLDVGGAAGRYALPLAALGHRVHLVDPAPLHLDQARAASSRARAPLASVTRGDAGRLRFDDCAADVVLLLGPLYHLQERADRIAALREAVRVLRPGGVVVAAAISRWASAVDEATLGFLGDPAFAEIVDRDLSSGRHENPTGRPGWFTTAYFHRPEELRAELEDVALEVDGPVAVEGIGRLVPDLDLVLADRTTRDRALALVRATEREPALLGVSSHLLAAGRTRA
jgi:SAM-dependent methyltransferase